MDKRVIVAHRDPLACWGFRALLEAHGQYTLLDQVRDGAVALQRCLADKPDLLLLDLAIPRVSSVAVIESLRRHRCSTRTLVLYLDGSDHDLFAVVRAGAAGVINLGEEDDPEQLLAAVAAVIQGNIWLSPSLYARLAGNAPRAPRHAALTPREREVLALIAAGLDNAAIAARLHVSRQSVRNHVSTIYQKLGGLNRVQAARYAIQHGLVWDVMPDGTLPWAEMVSLRRTGRAYWSKTVRASVDIPPHCS